MYSQIGPVETSPTRDTNPAGREPPFQLGSAQLRSVRSRFCYLYHILFRKIGLAYIPFLMREVVVDLKKNSNFMIKRCRDY